MKLSKARIKQLKQLLEDELGLKYKDEDLEVVALAIARFVYAKEVHKAHSKRQHQLKDPGTARVDPRPIKQYRGQKD